ncbi:MAG: hypothetical protein R2874_02865 [Desulfobacterales bacterium]
MLTLYAGKRHFKLTPSGFSDFIGKRAQRGKKLPGASETWIRLKWRCRQQTVIWGRAFPGKYKNSQLSSIFFKAVS